jgi:hypothetical protein
MNRHARRAAAARHRGYAHRLRGLHLPPGLHHATVEHDATCAIYRGRGCSCTPDVSIVGPDGVVTTVDVRGVGIRRTRS